MRLFRIVDRAGTEVFLNVDKITTMYVPSRFGALTPGATQEQAHITLGTVALKIDTDEARKLSAFLEPEVINPEEEGRRILSGVQQKLTGQN